MALLPPGPTHLAVRWLHVLAMATLVGGALLCWGLLRRRDADPIPLLRTYEWLFWASAGVAVLTGVGNLGVIAPAIPRPTTSWGVAFSVKLVGVLALFPGSAVRTMGVLDLAGSSTHLTKTTLDRLRIGYAATTIWLLGILVLAEVLAHG